ncbi:hypothetical protein PIB30_068093, partial [Stylosanthes scabra]|nr:hypothetical protein [Stylosanthes scabra]
KEKEEPRRGYLNEADRDVERRLESTVGLEATHSAFPVTGLWWLSISLSSFFNFFHSFSFLGFFISSSQPRIWQHVGEEKVKETVRLCFS